MYMKFKAALNRIAVNTSHRDQSLPFANQFAKIVKIPRLVSPQ